MTIPVPAPASAADRAAARRRGSVLIGLGLLGLAAAGVGLVRDVGFIAQPFYAYAWWSTIAVVAGWVTLRRGDSILSRRRGVLAPLLVWSVSFWFFFELLNLRFHNWYYVGVYAARSWLEFLLGLIFGVLCFATVFTGMFAVAEALAVLGAFARVRLAPRPLPPGLSYAVQGLGLAMVGLALLYPYYLAPLVWGSLTFLVDPWCYRRGARSLLGDLERGEVRPALRLLASGLVCGLLWEGFNYLAPQKWIYTVHGLEELKLFEMPLLGFLGFPALALDAFAAFAAVSYRFHGNLTWESAEGAGPEPPPGNAGLARGGVTHPPLSRRAFATLLPLHLVFWGLVTFLAQEHSIGSLELDLGGLDTLPPPAAARLSAAGIARPGQLLAALADPAERSQVIAAAGLSAEEAAVLAEEVRLRTLKGIGADHGRLLLAAGVHSVADLAAEDPDSLYRRLARLRAGKTFPALRPDMVRVWVRAARAER